MFTLCLKDEQVNINVESLSSIPDNLQKVMQELNMAFRIK